MLVLRHASAGERLSSPALDRARQLDHAGRADADRLPEAFAGHRLERIVTSPHARCLETVFPVAAATGLEIELRQELAPDASIHSVLALLDELPTASLVCTHREVIERLFQVRCEKAAAWLLERRDDGWIPVAISRPQRASNALAGGQLSPERFSRCAALSPDRHNPVTRAAGFRDLRAIGIRARGFRSCA